MATTTPPSRAMSIILNHHRRHGSIEDTDLRDLLIQFRETVINREMPKADAYFTHHDRAFQMMPTTLFTSCRPVCS